MKIRTSISLIILAASLPAAAALAQDSTDTRPADEAVVCRFVDEDGDGFNDLAPDHDGDGIPNGLDPDWVKPQDGQGALNRFAFQYSEMLRRFFGADVAPGGEGVGAGPHAGEGPGAGPGEGFGPGEDAGAGSGAGEPQQVQQRRQGRR